MMSAEALKIQAKRRGERRFERMAMRRNASETIHCTARNLTFELSRLPPGK